MANNWGGVASERTLRQVRDVLIANQQPGEGPSELRDEIVNVQEYVRSDGTTKRVVESIIVDGVVARTTTTNYAPIITED